LEREIKKIIQERKFIIMNRRDNLSRDQAKKIVEEIVGNSKMGDIFIGTGNFYSNIQYTANRLGYIDLKSMHDNVLSKNDELKCYEEVWNYIISGVLAPGTTQNYSSTDFFKYWHLTELGKKIIENPTYNPHDSDDYIGKIMEQESKLIDKVSKTYLLEALRTFKMNCCFGAVVLLGMSVEAIFIQFLRKLKNYVNFEITESINLTFKNLVDTLKPLKNDLPKDINYNLELWLSEFLNYIRQTRDESHHPVINTFPKEEVYGLFLRFPMHLNKLNKLLAHFEDQN